MILYVKSEYLIDNFGAAIPEDLTQRFLTRAQREVEGYCSNSIMSIIKRSLKDEFPKYSNTCLDVINDTFGIFSEYEMDKIKTTICDLAIFLYENGDVLNSPITSMSVNGASVAFSKEDVEDLKYNILGELDNTRFRNAYY